LRAAHFLREEAVAGPIFHNAVSAGAIIMANGTRISPFLDARWAGTRETIALYQAIRQASDATIASAWGEVCDSRGIETAMLDFYEMPALLRWLLADAGWALVHVDETSAVFCRRQGRNQAVIEECEPRVLKARAEHDTTREAALAGAVLRFLESRRPPAWKPLDFPYGAFYRSNFSSQARLPHDAQVAFLDLLDRERGSLHVSSHRIDILNNILWTLLESDQAAAIASLAEVLADSPEIDAARRPSLRLRQAGALARLGEREKAGEVAEAVAQDVGATAQERWTAWCRVADLRSRENDHEGAVEALQSAARQRPRLAETYRTIGAMLDLRLSRPAEALEAYERFRDLGGTDTLVEERIRLLRERTD
jgi:tetratricopeptide (TPR) repeat protein